MKTGKTVFLALCLAAGLVLSYVEAVLPIAMPVPGAKIGLPNIVTVLLLYTCGAAPAFTVSLARAVLSGFMFGNLFAILYSVSGLTLSLLSMALLKKTGRFGMLGVSAAGGVTHNLGQLIAAALLTNGYVFLYLPALILIGTLAGVMIGISGGILVKRLTPFLRKTFGQL